MVNVGLLAAWLVPAATLVVAACLNLSCLEALADVLAGRRNTLLLGAY